MTDNTLSSSRPLDGQTVPPDVREYVDDLHASHGDWLMALEDRLLAVERRADRIDGLILQIIAALEVLYPEVRDDFAAMGSRLEDVTP